jgi:hypothetical protein
MGPVDKLGMIVDWLIYGGFVVAGLAALVVLERRKE